MKFCFLLVLGILSACASDAPVRNPSADPLSKRPKAERVWILAVEGGEIPPALLAPLPPNALTFPETVLGLPLRLTDLLYPVLVTGKYPFHLAAQDRLRRGKDGRVLPAKKVAMPAPPELVDFTVITAATDLPSTQEKMREEISKGTAIWLVGVPPQPVADLCGPPPKTWAGIPRDRIVAACVGENIRLWLDSRDRTALATAARHMRKIVDADEIFVRYPLGESQQWVRHFRAKESLASPASGLRTDPTQEAMNTIANAAAPDLYVWLKTGERAPTTAFPLVVWAPNLKEGVTKPERVRWVDVTAMSYRLLEKPVPETLDGNASAIEPFLTPKF